MRAPIILAILAALALALPAAADDPGWEDPRSLGEWAGTDPVGLPGGELLLGVARPRLGEDYYDAAAKTIKADGTQIVEPLPGRVFGPPSVVASRRGDAAALWTDYSSGSSRLLLAIRAAGAGAFGPPAEVVGTGEQFTQTSLAMNAVGDVVVAWGRLTSAGERIWASFRPAGGALTTPVPVSGTMPDGNNQAIHAGLADAGEAVITWEPPYGKRALAAVTGSAASFAGEQTVAPAQGDWMRPALAVDPAGGAVLTWLGPATFHADGSSERDVFASVRSPGGAFGTGRRVGVAVETTYVRMAVDAAGRALAVFSDGSARLQLVVADTRTGTVSDARPIAGPAGDVRIAITPTGTAVAVFETLIRWDRVPYGAAIYAVWGDSSGSFGPPRNVTCPQPWRRLGQLGISPDGRAGLGVWNLGALTGHSVDDEPELIRSSAAIPADGRACADYRAYGFDQSGSPTGSAEEPPPGSGAPPEGARVPGAAVPALRMALPRRLPRLRRPRRLVVPLAATVDGVVRVQAVVRAGRRSLRLRTARLRIRGGARADARLQLTRRAVALVRRFRRGRLVVKATLAPPGGSAVSARGVATLRR